MLDVVVYGYICINRINLRGKIIPQYIKAIGKVGSDVKLLLDNRSVLCDTDYKLLENLNQKG